MHTGGTDLIPIHHTNEIAQVEAVTNKKFVNFWLHGEFLVLKDARMGKSKGNVILIKDIEKLGFSPLAFRYLVLNSHYKASLEFSLKALENAQESLNNIYNFVLDEYIYNTDSTSDNDNESIYKFDKTILEQEDYIGLRNNTQVNYADQNEYYAYSQNTPSPVRGVRK